MYKEPDLTEQEILDDFKNKHEFDISGMNIKVLEALVRYSRMIGYNEGFKDKKKEEMEYNRCYLKTQDFLEFFQKKYVNLTILSK